MKRGFVFLLIFLILITSINTTLSFDADENVGNLSHSIQEFYGPSENIKGWINISLEDEPVNSLFEGGEGDPISLIDLLETKINKDFNYKCNPLSCGATYSADEPRETKTFDLDKDDSVILGFRFEGNITSITSVDFDIESDVSSSCYNQIYIDLFNDGKINIVNNKSLYAPQCDDVLKKYGCFNSSKTPGTGSISAKYYCQRIRLTESPGFWLGAWVREDTAGTKKLTMELYSKSGVALKNCILPKDEIPENGGEVVCDINYSVIKSDDYYVCIYSNEGSGDYRIKGYSDSNGCGFEGVPTGSNPEIAAYNISAEGKRFAAIKTLDISNSLPNEDETIADKVHDYLTSTYGIQEGHVDCSPECVVPVKFISGKDQNLITNNLTIIYNKVGLSGAHENNFYNISEESIAKINADFQKLYLDEGNFSVPDDFGDYTFTLDLGGEEIFEEEVDVERVPEIKNLKPRTTAAAYPTGFEVTVESESNITEYEWDFGDNDTQTTSINKVTHTYNSIGDYELKVKIIDLNQRSSEKIFDISVGSPKEIINKILKKMLGDLSNIKEQIEEFPTFYQDSLEPLLDTDSLEDKLEEIQQANASASDEEDYSSILAELLKLNIPESLSTSISADSISYYPDENNINLDILKTIGGGDYDTSDEDKYIEAIFGWNQENMETKITFNELSAEYEDVEEPILKIFELNINKKNDTSNPYLILRELDDLKFKEDYSEKSESGYVYIHLDEPQTTITFSTTEDVSFTDLPLFISPAINELSIMKGPNEKNEQLLKLAIFILILFLLAIIGIVSYIILQEWYKKKYENYLFKNRNDLYNLISYVQSSKKEGLEDKEIISKLKKSGWKYEQINYVIKKYAGKRIGMPEIPIGKIFSKFKKKKSIPPGKLPKQFPSKKFSGSNLNKKSFFKI